MQHQIEKTNANRPIAIDVDGEPQGVVIPTSDGYRFIAVRFDAFAMDGQLFETVAAAREAARRVLLSDA